MGNWFRLGEGSFKISPFWFLCFPVGHSQRTSAELLSILPGTVSLHSIQLGTWTSFQGHSSSPAISQSSYALAEHLHVPSWGFALCSDHRENSVHEQFLKNLLWPESLALLCLIPFSKNCLIISLRASNEVLFRYPQKKNTFFAQWRKVSGIFGIAYLF